MTQIMVNLITNNLIIVCHPKNHISLFDWNFQIHEKAHLT
jgi:hypothetical protein